MFLLNQRIQWETSVSGHGFSSSEPASHATFESLGHEATGKGIRIHWKVMENVTEVTGEGHNLMPDEGIFPSL